MASTYSTTPTQRVLLKYILWVLNDVESCVLIQDKWGLMIELHPPSRKNLKIKNLSLCKNGNELNIHLGVIKQLLHQLTKLTQHMSEQLYGRDYR